MLRGTVGTVGPACPDWVLAVSPPPKLGLLPLWIRPAASLCTSGSGLSPLALSDWVHLSWHSRSLLVIHLATPRLPVAAGIVSGEQTGQGNPLTTAATAIWAGLSPKSSTNPVTVAVVVARQLGSPSLLATQWGRGGGPVAGGTGGDSWGEWDRGEPWGQGGWESPEGQGRSPGGEWDGQRGSGEKGESWGVGVMGQGRAWNGSRGEVRGREGEILTFRWYPSCHLVTLGEYRQASWGAGGLFPTGFRPVE